MYVFAIYGLTNETQIATPFPQYLTELSAINRVSSYGQEHRCRRFAAQSATLRFY